jgi:hypothetical protein
MLTPEQIPDVDLDVQELTEANIEKVSGGTGSPKLFSADPDSDDLNNACGAGGLRSAGGKGGFA